MITCQTMMAYVSWPLPPPPPALEVPGDLDVEVSRDRRSGECLGLRLTGCDGGIDERPREEFFFA
jgi:hypothetical protein